MQGIQTKSFRRAWLILLLGFAGVITAQAQSIVLINWTNTVWKFRPNTNDPAYTPADSWTAVGFNDSAWLTGQGLFGYESTANEYDAFGQFHTYIVPPNGVAAGNPIFPGQAGSPVSTGPTGGGTGGPSAYFRAHFNWTGPTANAILSFTNAVDDAIIVYLNGQELYSFDMPDTPRPMTWDINLLAAANPLGEAVPVITNIFNSPLLVAGDNVIAVELHQQANTSSDDVFAMKLVGTQPKAPVNILPAEPADRTVFQNHVTTLITRADPATAPAPTYQWSEDGADIAGATAASYTFTNTAVGDEPHTFRCHVANVIGSYDTRIANILFRTDTIRPGVTRVVGSATGDTVTIDGGLTSRIA